MSYNYASHYIYIYIYVIIYGMHKLSVLLLNLNPMLILVPYLFGYQFISVLSSLFLFT